MYMISEVAAAYWSLAYTQMRLQYASESVNIARKIVLDNHERLKNGKIAESELVESQAGLSSRLIFLSNCQQDFENANSQLHVLLSFEDIDNDLVIKTTTDLALSNNDTAFYRQFISDSSQLQHP